MNWPFILTPQPLYNTIVWVQANFCVSYPIHAILRVKCIGIFENHSIMTIWGPALILVISKSMMVRNPKDRFSGDVVEIRYYRNGNSYCIIM